MQVCFLFWNLKERPLQRLVAASAAEHQAQVVMLAECQIDPGVMIAELETAGCVGFTHPVSPVGIEGDIRIFVKFPESSLHSVYDDANNHVTIRRLQIDRVKRLLLVVVHSQSKRNWSDADQAQGATRLARRIIAVEQAYPRDETVLVGDLNMNPFEMGIVGSEGLHAVMTRQIARKGKRMVDGEDRRFFYNPMWRFFGERPEGPPGTHYYEGSGKPTTYFWNIFDQVMVRPNLVDALSEVRVVNNIGGMSLLDADGIPDLSVGSDHLPLLFSLNL